MHAHCAIIGNNALVYTYMYNQYMSLIIGTYVLVLYVPCDLGWLDLSRSSGIVGSIKSLPRIACHGGFSSGAPVNWFNDLTNKTQFKQCRGSVLVAIVL